MKSRLGLVALTIYIASIPLANWFIQSGVVGTQAFRVPRRSDV